MKIAFIHNQKKIRTGAHQINDLVSKKLQEKGVEMKHFYPRTSLGEIPVHLAGLKNILFFYSLLEKRNEVLKSDLIQGTTYTPLAFLAFQKPVICHFGSTTRGFLDCTPKTQDLEKESRQFWIRLFNRGVIKELNIFSRKPMRDIAEIESYVAKKAAAVIATSQNVRKELEALGVPEEKIFVVHNAIEDDWFDASQYKSSNPGIVYLGRLGANVFDFKLKGLDRIACVYNAFPDIPKISIVMTPSKKIFQWLKNSFSSHETAANLLKPRIKEILKEKSGSVLLMPSRYEGFSLSLIEGMSQGLIPVSFPVGVAPEIIENEKNGFIVHSTKEMIERTGLLLHDRVLRNSCARAAQKTAQKFKAEKMVASLLPIYSLVSGQSEAGNSKNKKKDFCWIWR